VPTRTDVIETTRRLLPRLGHITSMVAAETVEKLSSGGEQLESMAAASSVVAPIGGELPMPRTRLERAAAAELSELVATGARSLDKLRDGRDLDLSDDEVQGLEAIVRLEGRPAIVVQNGSFMQPPAAWASLNDARAAITDAVARVGRIAVTGHPEYDWVGTGFLVAADLLMTNEHVAREFSRFAEGRWQFRPQHTAGVDLRAEYGSDATLTFAVTEVAGVHDTYDLALLRVAPQSGDGALPTPLSVAAAPPERLRGLPVYAIGYPAWDGKRNEPAAMRRIFLDIYNVKRLQPGEITSNGLAGAAFHHDCSTLGGNSGSPLLDLTTHRVIGLHFGGDFMQRNQAIALWTLIDDPLLRDRVVFAS
jgi:V8-like Glu-specific endopeptidase